MRSPKENVLKAISEKVLRIRNPMKRKVFKERLFTYGKKENKGSEGDTFES